MSERHTLQRTYRKPSGKLVKETLHFTPDDMHTAISEMIEPRYQTKYKKWNLLIEIATKVETEEIERN